jgi:hypothetical protein
MANTVTTISYANTFGQWMVATDALIGENNTLAKNDYTKDTGTIYLSETTKNALQSNGNIVVQKQLLVQGSGSSATIDNNLTVSGQVYFSNTTLGLTNSGQANINGLLIVQGPGIGLYVANNASVAGNTTVRYNTITNTIQANSSVNTSNASITGTTYTNVLQANSYINTGTAYVTGVTYTDTLQANTSTNTATAFVTGTTFTNVLQANTSTNTVTASVTGKTYTDTLQANTSTNTATAFVTGTTFTDTLQANTSTNTATAFVTGTTFTNVLQANGSVNTATASITGTTFTNVLQANTSTNTATASVTGTTFTNVLQANNSVNTTIISITDTTFTKVLQANTSTNTATASVTGTTFTDILQANTSVNTSIISVTNSVITKDIQANNTISAATSLVANTISANVSASIPLLTISTKLDGNSAAAFLDSLQVQGGGLTVNGNFTLTGSTIYAANTFQLSTGATSGISSYLQVARGSSGVNAAIRWSEPSLYWETLDVTGNIYSRIITENYLANQTGSVANSAFGTANSASIYANSAYGQANSAASYANSAFSKANSAYAAANNAVTTYIGTTGSFSTNTVSFSSNNGITVVATSSNNFAISTSQDLRTSASPTFNGLVLINALGTSYGGTGATSPSGALTNILPTGTTAGYVLTTGGPGNFYWAASSGGAGGGATPGTSINSTRLSYTANGQSGYTGNSFIIPAATTGTQVRAYINGVRQFESEYALNLSANTIAFTTTPPSGDSILVEVDGYYVNPYYANNIAFTVNSNISSTANTIQLAIDGLTSKVTTYYSNLVATSTYTADVRGITMDAGTSNTSFATTAFAQYLANNSTYGVYTNGSYSNPIWITSLANTKISGVITASQLASTSVSAGTYGGSSNIPVITVDAQGRLTSAANVSVTQTAVYGNTNQITANTSTGVVALGLANTAVSPGTYGGLSTIPFITVDQKGRLTSAGNISLSSSNTQIYSLGVGVNATGIEGEIVSTGSITSGYSDDNLKTKLGNIENALEKVSSLNGFYYQANEIAQSLGYSVKKEVGVSAQEVQKVLPEIVVPAPINDKYLTVQYERIIPLLIEAIKELKEEIDVLKGQNK